MELCLQDVAQRRVGVGQRGKQVLVLVRRARRPHFAICAQDVHLQEVVMEEAVLVPGSLDADAGNGPSHCDLMHLGVDGQHEALGNECIRQRLHGACALDRHDLVLRVDVDYIPQSSQRQKLALGVDEAHPGQEDVPVLEPVRVRRLLDLVPNAVLPHVVEDALNPFLVGVRGDELPIFQDLPDVIHGQQNEPDGVRSSSYEDGARDPALHADR
mmetsp:Transcript_50435/g.134867  ORF Transcript_50435/g.134867 Transcript_50435/m.134867 type:complete len:214 (-) Transcript_50435:66-707(-)